MFDRLKAHIPDSMKRRLRQVMGPSAFSQAYFSQEGEDILLGRLFNDGRPGTFVDVGAHHPFRFSNTYALYRRGWRGINIDAMPGSMALFRRHRRHDINLEIGVASQASSMSFTVFDEPALNTFDAELALAREQGGQPVLRRVTVECLPLSEILARHPIPVNGRNSFLSIDVEGLDLQVLQSNDWFAYRPSIIVVEAAGKSVAEILASVMVRYLGDQGYVLFSKLAHSVLFKRVDF